MRRDMTLKLDNRKKPFLIAAGATVAVGATGIL
jgi:hypothetical protein